MSALQNLLPDVRNAYGKGVTGFDPQQVQKSIKQEVDFQRQERKSLYDIGKDLDAAAWSAFETDFTGLVDKINNNEIKVGGAEFYAEQQRLKALANGLKQTQDLVTSVMKEGVKNPDGYVYIQQDEDGRIIDRGFEGLATELANISSAQYGTPQQYIDAVTTPVTQGLQKRIDPRQLNTDMEKAAEKATARLFEGVDVTRAAIKAMGEAKKIGQGQNYLMIPKELGDKVDEVKNFLIDTFSPALEQEYAVERRKGTIGKDITLDEYKEDRVLGYIQRSKAEFQTFRDFFAPQPRQTKQSEDKSLRRTSDGGGWQYGNYIFEPSSTKIGKKETVNVPQLFGLFNTTKTETKEIDVQGVKVTNEKAQTAHQYRNQKGQPVNGKAFMFFRAPETGEMMLLVNAGKEKQVVPFDENRQHILETFGLTESDIDMMIRGGEDSGKSGGGKEKVNW